MTTNLPSVIADTPVPITQMAQQVADSRFFADALTPATALVKLAAGRELGLPMMSSLQNIHVIKGKATLGYSLVAAMIRRHPNYDYRVLEHTDEVCTIQFLYYRGDISDVAGESTFTMRDAQAAGLLGNPSWKKFPRNMLFARAITNGARFHCPDVFMGAVYTRDELDDGMADIDHGDASEFADVIDMSDVPPPLWQTRWAGVIDTIGEQAGIRLLRGADPTILGRDDAWTRFQEIMATADAGAGDGPGDHDAPPPATGDAPADPSVISQAQLTRLAAIAGELRLADADWKQIACHVADVTSRKLIPKDRYDQVEQAMREAAAGSEAAA